MKEECLVCGKPLAYLTEQEPMTCVFCGQVHASQIRCEAGHYVCSSCHMRGLDAVFACCLKISSADPVEILGQLMNLSGCHMHGPEHHVIAGAALLTACANAGAIEALEKPLRELFARGVQVPGGICGYWGCCGAAISTGIFASVITGATPLKGPERAAATHLTSRVLDRLASVGGPRCCKRGCFAAMEEGVSFARDVLGIKLEPSPIRCAHSQKNAQCMGRACPYFAGKRRTGETALFASAALIERGK